MMPDKIDYKKMTFRGGGGAQTLPTPPGHATAMLEAVD